MVADTIKASSQRGGIVLDPLYCDVPLSEEEWERKADEYRLNDKAALK
ncbi:MAG: hypothetical protein ACK4PK_09895 [Alphaproteobacteria bacterium]